MINFRKWGDGGPSVVLLHGGPGARGDVAPLALQLKDSFQVLEPLQRRASNTLLTVAKHIQDLHELLNSESYSKPPALVGFSWGAMLALAYATEYSESISQVILISCGTFDKTARAVLQQRRRERPSSDEVEPIQIANAFLEYDEAGGQESWADMLRLQVNGTYPAKFAQIEVPVTMIHGAQDPHPGKMIRDSLLPFIPALTYIEIPNCGHTPWLERCARTEFIAQLNSSLLAN